MKASYQVDLFCLDANAVSQERRRWYEFWLIAQSTSWGGELVVLGVVKAGGYRWFRDDCGLFKAMLEMSVKTSATGVLSGPGALCGSIILYFLEISSVLCDDHGDELKSGKET